MKTTNFENSKKLAEIGFKAQSNFGYNRAEGDSIKYEVPRGYDNVYYLSYDLETLLDALPKNFLIKNARGIKTQMIMMHRKICFLFMLRKLHLN